MGSIVFKCPQCGAPFEFIEGNRVATCTFCGMVSAIAGDSGINRLLIPERIDMHSARSTVRKILASNAGESYAASFGAVSSELVFLPFWRIKGMAIGWQWQQKEMYQEEVDYDDNGTRYTKQTRKPDEKKFSSIARPLDMTMPAGDYRLFGAVRSGMAASVLKSEVMDFCAVSKRGTVINPLKGLSRARVEAQAILQQEWKNSSGVMRNESRIRIANEWNSLVYYPVWNLFFEKGDKIYPVTVDAVGGEITRCHFPGEKHRAPFLPLALIALFLWGWTTSSILGVIVTVLAWWILSNRFENIDLHTVVSFFIDLPRREAGVQRG